MDGYLQRPSCFGGVLCDCGVNEFVRPAALSVQRKPSQSRDHSRGNKRLPYKIMSTLSNTAMKKGTSSNEYVEALGTLSNTTMKKAYNLLSTQSDGTNSIQQLTQLLEQCKNASKVIQAEATPPSVPTSSSTSAPPAPRPVPRGIVTKNLLPPPSRRMSGLPRLNNSKRIKVERQKSDSSFKLKDPPEPNASSAPPPSAMQFLAKLNKSTTTTKKHKRKEPKKSAPEPLLPPTAAPEESEEKELVEEEMVDDDEDEEELELDDEDEEPTRPRRQSSRREVPLQQAGTPPSRRQPSRSSKK